MKPNEVKELAEKATPGPWKSYKGFTPPQSNDFCRLESMNAKSESIVGYIFDEPECKGGCDSEFIAAANPEFIIKLIEDWEQMRNELTNIRTAPPAMPDELNSCWVCDEFIDHARKALEQSNKTWEQK